MANTKTGTTKGATATAKGGKVSKAQNEAGIVARAAEYAAKAQVGLAAVTGNPTIAPAQTVQAALLGGMIASLASAGNEGKGEAKARTRTPAHTGGIFGHVCTVGRRAGKVWYATESTGYSIAAIFTAQGQAGRKACIAAGVAAGFSAGSVTSCWGDYVAFNASLTAAGLLSLAHAYNEAANAALAEGLIVHTGNVPELTA